MTDQDHAKIVREARVTQADRQIWFETLTAGCKVPELIEHCRRSCIERGEADDLPVMEAIVRSRLAAEAAAFEKAAGVAEVERNLKMQSQTIEACALVAEGLRRKVPYEYNRPPCAITMRHAANAIRALRPNISLAPPAHGASTIELCAQVADAAIAKWEGAAEQSGGHGAAIAAAREIATAIRKLAGEKHD